MKAHRQPGPAHGAGGFSLLGLLLILVGLSAVAVVAIPRFFERPEVTLEKGALLLAEDLRVAQNRAAYGHEPLFLVFEADGDGYKIVDASDVPILDPRTDRPFRRRYSTDGVFEGLTIVDLQAGPQDTLIFTPTGETSEHLEVRMRFQDEERVVAAQRGTGLVEIRPSTSGFVDDGL